MYCIGSEAFSYPYGPMWTAVLGDYNRADEEGHEQRLLVNKVILHERFKEYHNDIGGFKAIQARASSGPTRIQ